MLILALDSSTPVAGAALVDDERVLNETFSNYKKTHSQTLMPAVDRIMRECECSIGDIDALAVTSGPGSFTGLRIGMATVKGISLASEKPIIAVSTLDTLACNAAGSDAMACALLDARKNELYCGFYDVSAALPVSMGQPMVCTPEKFITAAQNLADNNKKDRIILMGDGYYTYSEFLEKNLRNRLLPMPGHLMFPRAAAVGILAFHKARKGEYEDVYQMRPRYIRLSEAEYRLGKGAL